MFNPVIIIAIIIQALVTKFSRIAGAVMGYLITTGILLWGLSLYNEGDQIAFFGIPLSEPIFIILCIVWYGFDTRDFLAARKGAAGVTQTGTGSPSTPASKRRLPALALWFLWLITNGLANLGWGMVYPLFNPTFDESHYAIANIASGVSSGMIAGFLQWLLLILVIPNASRRILAFWLPASIFGWAIAPIIYALVTVPTTMSLLIYGVNGVTIGILQWLILRKYSKTALWWIPASVIDWVAVTVLAQSNILVNLSDFYLINFILGMVGAFVSSIAIVLILRKTPDLDSLQTENNPIDG